MTAEDRVHACTVNGQDAQYWFDEAERWKERAGQEHFRGREAANKAWSQATGYIDIRAYKDAHREVTP